MLLMLKVSTLELELVESSVTSSVWEFVVVKYYGPDRRVANYDGNEGPIEKDPEFYLFRPPKMA